MAIPDQELELSRYGIDGCFKTSVNGWFDITGEIILVLEVQVSHVQCIPKGYDIVWSTEDGNIIGDNNANKIAGKLRL